MEDIIRQELPFVNTPKKKPRFKNITLPEDNHERPINKPRFKNITFEENEKDESVSGKYPIATVEDLIKTTARKQSLDIPVVEDDGCVLEPKVTLERISCKSPVDTNKEQTKEPGHQIEALSSRLKISSASSVLTDSSEHEQKLSLYLEDSDTSDSLVSLVPQNAQTDVSPRFVESIEDVGSVDSQTYQLNGSHEVNDSDQDICRTNIFEKLCGFSARKSRRSVRLKERPSRKLMREEAKARFENQIDNDSIEPSSEIEVIDLTEECDSLSITDASEKSSTRDKANSALHDLTEMNTISHAIFEAGGALSDVSEMNNVSQHFGEVNLHVNTVDQVNAVSQNFDNDAASFVQQVVGANNILQGTEHSPSEENVHSFVPNADDKSEGIRLTRRRKQLAPTYIPDTRSDIHFVKDCDICENIRSALDVELDVQMPRSKTENDQRHPTILVDRRNNDTQEYIDRISVSRNSKETLCGRKSSNEGSSKLSAEKNEVCGKSVASPVIARNRDKISEQIDSHTIFTSEPRDRTNFLKSVPGKEGTGSSKPNSRRSSRLSIDGSTADNSALPSDLNLSKHSSGEIKDTGYKDNRHRRSWRFSGSSFSPGKSDAGVKEKDHTDSVNSETSRRRSSRLSLSDMDSKSKPSIRVDVTYQSSPKAVAHERRANLRFGHQEKKSVGRPRKLIVYQQLKKKIGRPRNLNVDHQGKRKLGRPRKLVKRLFRDVRTSDTSRSNEHEIKKKIGRPRKLVTEDSNASYGILNVGRTSATKDISDSILKVKKEKKVPALIDTFKAKSSFRQRKTETVQPLNLAKEGSGSRLGRPGDSSERLPLVANKLKNDGWSNIYIKEQESINEETYKRKLRSSLKDEVSAADTQADRGKIVTRNSSVTGITLSSPEVICSKTRRRLRSSETLQNSDSKPLGQNAKFESMEKNVADTKHAEVRLKGERRRSIEAANDVFTGKTGKRSGDLIHKKNNNRTPQIKSKGPEKGQISLTNNADRMANKSKEEMQKERIESEETQSNSGACSEVMNSTYSKSSSNLKCRNNLSGNELSESNPTEDDTNSEDIIATVVLEEASEAEPAFSDAETPNFSNSIKVSVIMSSGKKSAPSNSDEANQESISSQGKEVSQAKKDKIVESQSETIPYTGLSNTLSPLVKIKREVYTDLHSHLSPDKSLDSRSSNTKRSASCKSKAQRPKERRASDPGYSLRNVQRDIRNKESHDTEANLSTLGRTLRHLKRKKLEIGNEGVIDRSSESSEAVSATSREKTTKKNKFKKKAKKNKSKSEKAVGAQSKRCISIRQSKKSEVSSEGKKVAKALNKNKVTPDKSSPGYSSYKKSVRCKKCDGCWYKFNKEDCGRCVSCL